MDGWDGGWGSPFDTPEERFWRGIRQNKSVSRDSHRGFVDRWSIEREEKE